VSLLSLLDVGDGFVADIFGGLVASSGDQGLGSGQVAVKDFARGALVVPVGASQRMRLIWTAHELRVCLVEEGLHLLVLAFTLARIG